MGLIKGTDLEIRIVMTTACITRAIVQIIYKLLQRLTQIRAFIRTRAHVFLLEHVQCRDLMDVSIDVIYRYHHIYISCIQLVSTI